MSPHVCPWWGGYFIDNPLRRWIHNPRQILAPHLQPGMTALDFGCGMGLFTLEMARLVGAAGRVVAADLQPQMLAVVGRRAARAGLASRIALHRCQADSIALAETVDFALAFWSAHEVPNQRRWLSEILACLRPHGRLLVVEPKGHVTRRDFDAMAASAGETGLAIQAEPSIRWSHAAVFAPATDRHVP